MTENKEKEMQLTVPYIVHEAAQARSERTIKRLIRATQNIIYRASEQLFKHIKF